MKEHSTLVWLSNWPLWVTDYKDRLFDQLRSAVKEKGGDFQLQQRRELAPVSCTVKGPGAKEIFQWLVTVHQRHFGRKLFDKTTMPKWCSLSVDGPPEDPHMPMAPIAPPDAEASAPEIGGGDAVPSNAESKSKRTEAATTTVPAAGGGGDVVPSVGAIAPPREEAVPMTELAKGSIQAEAAPPSKATAGDQKSKDMMNTSAASGSGGGAEAPSNAENEKQKAAAARTTTVSAGSGGSDASPAGGGGDVVPSVAATSSLRKVVTATTQPRSRSCGGHVVESVPAEVRRLEQAQMLAELANDGRGLGKKSRTSRNAGVALVSKLHGPSKKDPSKKCHDGDPESP